MATSTNNATVFMMDDRKDFDNIDPESIDSPLDTDSDCASEPFLHGEKTSRPVRTVRSPVWFVLAIALFVTLLLENMYLLVHPKPAQDTYEKGFDTEFDAIKPAIKLQQKRFSSAIRDDPNGTLYTVWNPDEPRFVGQPSPEIDQAWEALLDGRYIRFTANEVSLLNDDHGLPPLQSLPAHGNSIPQTGYYGGPDMLHSLHCVNAIRQHLDIDYYQDQMWLPEPYRRMHVDHCIDQLRQAVLCHGDMTPVTLKAIWTDTPKWALLGQTERMHTCRDGAALQKWVEGRGSQTGRITFGHERN